MNLNDRQSSGTFRTRFPCKNRGEQGFALVIALSLMAFVLLLLLSLSTFIWVESDSNAKQVHTFKARQNAFLALNMALGDLQMAAGPDQRATSTGDLVRDTHASKRQMTVVLDGTQPQPDGSPSVRWLVSQADRQSGFDAQKPVDHTWPILVSERTSVSGENYEPIRAEPIPVMEESRQSGELAWWVGDEGVKARVNLVEPESVYNSDDSRDRLQIAGRLGVESLLSRGEEDLSRYYTYGKSDFRERLQRMVSRDQWTLLPDSDPINSAFDRVIRDNFHTTSVFSRSLLTDAKNGGLKKDLSHILDGGSDSPSGAIIAGTKYVKGEDKLDPAFERVTWEQLASFNDLASETSDFVEARGQTEDQYGVAPILTVLKLHFCITIADDGWAWPYEPRPPKFPFNAENAATRGYAIHHHIRPFFVLANPYNRPLSANNYRIRFELHRDVEILLRVDEGTNQGAQAGYNANLRHVLNNMVFTVSQVNLEPGQAKIYFLYDKDHPDYDYEFKYGEAGQESFYSLFHHSNSGERQYLFEGTDEETGALFDGGISTIRINPAHRMTGDVLEVTDTDPEYADILKWDNGPGTLRRIAKLSWRLSRGAAFYVRTYVNGPNKLSDDEESDNEESEGELLQHWGPSWCSLDNEDAKDPNLGYWPSHKGFLPRSTIRFNGEVDTPLGRPGFRSRANPEDQGRAEPTPWQKMNRYPGASSILLNLLGAVNQSNTPRYSTGDDGWATDLNLRAKRFAGLEGRSNWWQGMYRVGSESVGGWHYVNLTAGDEGSRKGNNAGDGKYPWGAGISSDWDGTHRAPTGLPKKAVLFDIPRAGGDDKSALSSLGQLQHFDASGYTEWSPGTDPEGSIEDIVLSYTPSYTIGSSYASPFVNREGYTFKTTEGRQLVDWAYVLNDILFDSYFFSGYEPNSSSNPNPEFLQNGRLRRFDASLDLSSLEGSTSTAEALYVDGGFNVNSTSVDAWYTLLSSFRGVAFGDVDATNARGVFPRTLNQYSPYSEDTERAASVEVVTESEEDIRDAWAGWRHISDNEDPEDPQSSRQLYRLAEAIVDEVKARGPFLSLSDFVNRKLVNDSDPLLAHHGLSGPLQAALDRVINVDLAKIPEYAVVPANADRNPVYHSQKPSLKEHLGSGKIYESDGSEVKGTSASSASSIPGWIRQGDLLQSLAPVLSSRSDTFIVRTYGSHQHPLTGERLSEVYLEAIVQRMPEYVDQTDSADTLNEDLSSINASAGRKFRIIGYRFLQESEI